MKRRKKLQADMVYVPNLQKENTKKSTAFFQSRLKRQGLFDTYSEKKIVFEENTYPLGEAYYDSDDIIDAVGCTGFFTTVTKNVDIHYDDVKEVFLMQEKHENKRFKLERGETSVDEAAALAEREMNLCLKKLGYSCEVEVQRVMVYVDEEKRPFFLVLFQQSYKGIPIADVHNSRSKISDIYLDRDAGEAIIIGPKKEDIAELTFSEGCLEQYQENEIKKILSFAQATEALNVCLSEYKAYQVKEAALEYMLMPDGNLQENGKMGTGEKMQHRKEASWAITCSYDAYRLVPCWTFYMDITYKKEIVAYVNALTGKVNFVCNQ